MNTLIAALTTSLLLTAQPAADEFSVCDSPRCEARADGTVTWFDTAVKARGTVYGEDGASVYFAAYTGDTLVARAESTDGAFDLDLPGAAVDRVTIQVCSNVPAPPPFRSCNRPPFTLRRSAA